MIDYKYAVERLISGAAPHQDMEQCSGGGEPSTISPLSVTTNFLIDRGISWSPHLFSVFESGRDAGFVSDIVVHGSFGDFTQTRFSDIELTVVLNSSIECDVTQASKFRKWLTKDLNKLIFSIDPLQHHGAFFIWPSFANCYDEGVLPVAAYRDCWSCCGSSVSLVVKRNIKDCRNINEVRFRQTVESLLAAKTRFFRYGYSLYAIKRFLSNLFMLPVYRLQAKGMEINKREALSLLEECAFPDSLISALQKATDMRADWPESSRALKTLRKAVIGGKIPQGRIDNLICSGFRRKKIAADLRKNILPDVMLACKELSRLEI